MLLKLVTQPGRICAHKSEMVVAENSCKYAYQDNAYDTILGKAVISKSLPLIKYLFEELELVPSKTALESLKREAAQFSGREVNAYLESYLTESVDEKQLLPRFCAYQ